MKRLFILFLILNSSTSFAQTEKETVEWIMSKLDLYQRKYSIDVDIKQKLVIDDGYLYGYFYFDFDRKGKNVLESWSAIKIKDINLIGFYEDISLDHKYKWVHLGLFFDKGKMLRKEIRKIDNTEGDREYKIDPDYFTIGIDLDKSFFDDGMRPRMEKALKHLIKLNGGTAKMVETKKEPF